VEPDLDFAGALGVVQSVPPGGVDARSFLHRVAWLASAGEFSCGITALQGCVPATVAASDEKAARLAEVQYAAGEGPCLETIAGGKAIHVRDQQADQRWVHYRSAALSRGVQSSLSLPFFVEGAPAGALNLYDGRGPDGFDAAAQKRAEVFAVQAATAVALSQQISKHERTSGQVAAALRSRSAIDQALGILMAQERCDAETALGLLRHHSQTTNQKLRDVAVRLVERATGHRPSTPSDFES
jgi:GAF domain-containing protein